MIFFIEKEHNVQLCQAEDIKNDEELVVNYTDMEKQIMIVDSGSPVSLALNEWLV